MKLINLSPHGSPTYHEDYVSVPGDKCVCARARTNKETKHSLSSWTAWEVSRVLAMIHTGSVGIFWRMIKVWLLVRSRQYKVVMPLWDCFSHCLWDELMACRSLKYRLFSFRNVTQWLLLLLLFFFKKQKIPETLFFTILTFFLARRVKHLYLFSLFL